MENDIMYCTQRLVEHQRSFDTHSLFFAHQLTFGDIPTNVIVADVSRRLLSISHGARVVVCKCDVLTYFYWWASEESLCIFITIKW